MMERPTIMGPQKPMEQRKYLTSFIEFQLAIDEDVSEVFDYNKADDDMSKKWIKIMQPLRTAMGWQGGSWGRIVERPDTVLLLCGEFQ